MRRSPNVVITGTPGVGKTTHCDIIARHTGLKHLSVNKLVEDRDCHDGWDDEYKCWIVNDDKVCHIYSSRYSRLVQSSSPIQQVLDAIESEIEAGGCLIDWHACDLFPRELIDLVIVLRAETSTLYDRLIARYDSHQLYIKF